MEASTGHVPSLYDNNHFLLDTDLLCIFAGLVSLQTKMVTCAKYKYIRQIVCLRIYKSLELLPECFAEEWENWPFSMVKGGSRRMRDLRTFCALAGKDTCAARRRSDWTNASQAMAILFYDLTKSMDASLRVYTAKPLCDAIRFIPKHFLPILFGEKLSKVIMAVKHYCDINAPLLLAGDTRPVKTERSLIVPPGCVINAAAPNLTTTDKLTLVSRHAIPTARKLGLYMLSAPHHREEGGGVGGRSKRKLQDSNSSANSHMTDYISRSIAECMVKNTMLENMDDTDSGPAALVACPETEIKTVEAHVSAILSGGYNETCGICYKPLVILPKSAEGGSGGDSVDTTGTGIPPLDHFPLHAFMDTYECLSDSPVCSASVCTECAMRLVLSIYTKVTSTGGVKLKDAFRCPCCGEYMVNLMGRGYEFSSMCKRKFQLKRGLGIITPNTYGIQLIEYFNSGL